MKKIFFFIFIFHYSFLDSLATRGERLELLVNKTENLSASVCILSSKFLNYRARKLFNRLSALVRDIPKVVSQSRQIIILEKH